MRNRCIASKGVSNSMHRGGSDAVVRDMLKVPATIKYNTGKDARGGKSGR